MLARYSKENGVEFIWTALKKVKDLTPEVQSQISKLTNMIITDCNGTASALKITDESVIGFMGSMQESGTSYANAKEAIAGYQTYLKSTGQAAQFADIKTKALSVSMKVLSTLGWMAIATIATNVIGKGFEWINDYIHRVENAKTANKEFADSFKELKSSLDADRDTISSIAGRYNELSTHVNNLGTNIGLTKEEFEEYHNITQQIAEMYPSLVTGYDAQGNAIVNLKDAVVELNAEYEKAKENSYWEQIQKAPEVLKNFDTAINAPGKGLNVQLEGYQRLLRATQLEYKDFVLEISESPTMAQRLIDIGIDLDFKEEDMGQITQQILQRIQSINTEIEAEMRNVTPILESYLYTNDDYKGLGDDLKTALANIVYNIPLDTLTQFESGIDMSSWISEIVSMVSTNSDISDALVGLFSLDTSEMSVGEIKEVVDNYIGYIAELLDADEQELKIKLGFDDTDTDAMIVKVKDSLQDDFDDKVDELSLEDLEIAANKLENNPSVPLSWDELIAKIQEYKDSLKESDSTLPLSISDTITQLDTQLRPALDALKKSYQEIFTDDGFTLENVDISMLAGIKSQLESLGKELNVEIDYSSFEDFASVLNDTESTEYDVQKAFNELATTITNTALSGVEDFETLKAALEDFGIENSELVAFENLVGNTESLKKAGLDLATASEAQIIAFANEVVSAENVAQAIDMLTFAKLSADAANMDTSTEVANLKTLAENAGYTGDVIKYLTELEQIYQGITSGTIPSADIPGKLERAKELTALIQSSANNINYEPKFNGNSGKSSASKAGKEAADAYLEAFEKELKKLDDLKSRGKHNCPLLQ